LLVARFVYGAAMLPFPTPGSAARQRACERARHRALTASWRRMNRGDEHTTEGAVDATGVGEKGEGRTTKDELGRCLLWG
jgi:hypothetical protein